LGTRSGTTSSKPPQAPWCGATVGFPCPAVCFLKRSGLCGWPEWEFPGHWRDLATNASVQVDASQPPGLLITNGEFTAFSTQDWCPACTADSTQVVVGASNSGPVKFVDSSFWGPSDSIARLSGTGTTSFVSCEFVQWDQRYNKGSPAIDAEAGNLILIVRV
jgi:hypothetical protein